MRNKRTGLVIGFFLSGRKHKFQISRFLKLPGLNSGFFKKLPDGTLLNCFTRIYFAAWSVPLALAESAPLLLE
jgi:hypothetical protein